MKDFSKSELLFKTVVKSKSAQPMLSYFEKVQFFEKYLMLFKILEKSC